MEASAIWLLHPRDKILGVPLIINPLPSGRDQSRSSHRKATICFKAVVSECSFPHPIYGKRGLTSLACVRSRWTQQPGTGTVIMGKQGRACVGIHMMTASDPT